MVTPCDNVQWYATRALLAESQPFSTHNLAQALHRHTVIACLHSRSRVMFHAPRDYWGLGAGAVLAPARAAACGSGNICVRTMCRLLQKVLLIKSGCELPAAVAVGAVAVGSPPPTAVKRSHFVLASFVCPSVRCGLGGDSMRAAQSVERAYRENRTGGLRAGVIHILIVP